MANFTALKTAINNAIKTNGNEEITGAILQAILDAMVETLGDSAINDLENAITTEVTNRENAVGGVAADLAAEALARANKDNQLDNRINAEEYNRANADAALSQTMSQGFQTLGSQMTALNAAISALNAAYQNGYLYGGIATPSSSSPSNNKCFYIALQGGTYTNFGGVGVVEGINIIKNDGGWKVEHIYDQTTLLNEFYLLRQQVVQAITSFDPIVIEGDVTNAPDEEDLTSNANHLLQFKNNAYSPLEFSGLGRKYLRKNIAPLSESAPFNGFVEGVTAEESLSGTPTQIFWDRMNTRFVGIKDGVYYLDWTDSDNYVPVSTSLVYMYNGTPYQWTGSDFIVDETEVPNLVNCLTQDMINEANTIYIIRYDFTLKEDITIPANCVLQFDGGSISGGTLTLINSKMILEKGVVIELNSPIVLVNSIIEGNGGEIKAVSNYAHPYLINMTCADTVRDVKINLNNNNCIGIFTGTNVEAYCKILIENVEIFNGTKIKKGDISSISGDTITTSSAHGLSDGDIVEIIGVNGGFSTINPSESVYNRIYICKKISDTQFKVRMAGADIDDSSLFSGYSSYISGGEVYKIGVGIDLGINTFSQVQRKCILNDIRINNVPLGIRCPTENNLFSNIEIINGQNNTFISFYFYYNSLGTIINNAKIDSKVVVRTGAHGMMLNGINGCFRTDEPIFDIIGINADYGNAGGEVEGIVIDNAYIEVSTNNQSVIKTNAENFTLRNAFIYGTHLDNWYVVSGSITSSLFENIKIIGGNCTFTKADCLVTDTTFENIKGAQGQNYNLNILQTRLPLSDAQIINSAFIKVSNTNFNVKILSNNNTSNFIFSHITGILDLTDCERSTIISCANVINNTRNSNRILGNKDIINPIYGIKATNRYIQVIRELNAGASDIIALMKAESTSEYRIVEALVKVSCKFHEDVESLVGEVNYYFKLYWEVNSLSVTRITDSHLFTGTAPNPSIFSNSDEVAVTADNTPVINTITRDGSNIVGVKINNTVPTFVTIETVMTGFSPQVQQ